MDHARDVFCFKAAKLSINKKAPDKSEAYIFNRKEYFKI